jgi:hypothetical protein
MSEQSGLARRYRRWLAVYPKAYRRQHAEEMLTVLLSDARPGQRRPHLAEAADLLVGAVRIRLRLIQPYPGDAGRDALAIFAACTPLLLAGPALVTLALHLASVPPLRASSIPASVRPALRESLETFYRYRDTVELRFANGVYLAAAGQLAVTMAVSLRLKRVALALIAIILGWWILLGRSSFYPSAPIDEFFLICYLLEAAALVASPGPRRGLKLLTWKPVAVLVTAAATLTISWTFWMRLAVSHLGPAHAAPRELAAATAAFLLIGALVALASRPGRYLAGLYATMFYPIAVYLYGRAANEPQQITSPAVLFLPPLVAACVIVAVARRRSDPFRSDQRAGATPLGS